MGDGAAIFKSGATLDWRKTRLKPKVLYEAETQPI
jgi:hypothetical protein